MTDTMNSQDESQQETQNIAPEAMPESPPMVGQQPMLKGKAGQIEKIALDYVIPMSNMALEEWAKSSTPEEFKRYAEQVAVGMYPTFAPQIQSGIPTRILLDPYIQVAQQVLGPMAGTPNWSDPKWGAALQGNTDPKTGRPIPMSIDQWRSFLMQHPAHGWDKSPQAIDRARQFADILQKGFNTPRPAGGQ